MSGYSVIPGMQLRRAARHPGLVRQKITRMRRNPYEKLVRFGVDHDPDTISSQPSGIGFFTLFLTCRWAAMIGGNSGTVWGASERVVAGSA
jgi:hypothetical protein